MKRHGTASDTRCAHALDFEHTDPDQRRERRGGDGGRLHHDGDHDDYHDDADDTNHDYYDGRYSN